MTDRPEAAEAQKAAPNPEKAEAQQAANKLHECVLHTTDQDGHWDGRSFEVYQNGKFSQKAREETLDEATVFLFSPFGGKNYEEVKWQKGDDAGKSVLLELRQGAPDRRVDPNTDEYKKVHKAFDNLDFDKMLKTLPECKD